MSEFDPFICLLTPQEEVGGFGKVCPRPTLVWEISLRVGLLFYFLLLCLTFTSHKGCAILYFKNHLNIFWDFADNNNAPLFCTCICNTY